jgi:hopanoid biosynthesis associated radical SAM protein HpnH
LTIPLRQQVAIGAYIVKQRILGRTRYPLVLMLEPLFQCNLACSGCGKIDYPEAVLRQRLSLDECLAAVDECGAPVVTIPGGEPLLHKDIGAIVAGIVARRKFVYLCTNGLLLEKRLDLFTPSPYLTFTIHLDGLKEQHDKAVSQEGVYVRAVAAIAAARQRGFRVGVNTTLFADANPQDLAAFLDTAKAMGVEGVTIAPGYAYERAPDQAHFLSRHKTRELFRSVFRLGRGRKWPFNQSSLYLDFLAGNQTYRCSPWGTPTRNVFGWQRPCYLLNEGTVASFAELMNDTQWERYGTGNYEKCANCMAHCGYEPTAVCDAAAHPLKTLMVALRGPRTEGPMAADIPLDGQRPADFVFDEVVAQAVNESGPPADAGAGRQRVSG